APPVALDIRIRHPYRFVVDSCGNTAHDVLAGRCVTSLTDYILFGAGLDEVPISSSASVAYIPAHASLVRVHANGLAASIDLAQKSWRGLQLPRTTFVERPREPDEWSYYNDYWALWYQSREYRSAGPVTFVTE